jgi:hypothetical protein
MPIQTRMRFAEEGKSRCGPMISLISKSLLSDKVPANTTTGHFVGFAEHFER